ncbi:SGNH/GDSL hydrolase family protein [Gordonia bronchialis]|uniref:SGNH/GDSL hydrolase family protein n=1 Tax=Gordonia bronchialis TaxID=2054 RepID=UPI002430E07C|nr:SGNH/GDSL hydrolase family protein [Gordonia bronchialis]
MLPNSSSELGVDGLDLTQIPFLRDLLAPRTDPSSGRTGCGNVIQIGDSTSVGIDDASHAPNPADRLTARYRSVGARTVALDAVGGRSIVERVNGAPNADEAVATHRARGDRGCWVIAMGVNDAANIVVGSRVGADERIDRIMKQLRGQPVLWPTVVTGSTTVRGYSAAGMRSFNDALRRALSRYPNLAVYDWAAEVSPAWFADGIHYTATGTAERNRRFAAALAVAFPVGATTPAVRWVRS